LPVIDQPLLLDARLQPGYASRPIVAIDGAAAGATDGLSLGAPACMVGGLAIGRFQGRGIRVQATGAQVSGCWIGLAPGRSSAWANGGDAGLRLDGGNAVVGGITAAERNVISGNFGAGVILSSQGNRIVGNFVGVDAAGAAGVP